MNNPIEAGASRCDDLIRFGEMVYTNRPTSELQDELRRLLSTGEESPWSFPILCGSLSLNEKEAYCIALCMYVDSGIVPPLSVKDLRDHCKRFGSSQDSILSRLLDVSDGSVRLRPVIRGFLAESAPHLPAGARLELPGEDAGDDLHEPRLLEELTRFARRAITEEAPVPVVIILEGEPGCGRTYLFRRLASQLGCVLLCLPGSAMEPAVWDEMLLAAALYNAVICLEDIASDTQLEPLAEQAGMLLIEMRGRARPPETGRCLVLQRQVGAMNPERLGAYLEALLACLQMDREIPRYAMDMLANQRIGALLGLARQVQAEGWATGQLVTWERFADLIRAQASLGGPGVTVLGSSYLLDDLIIPRQQQTQLLRICTFSRVRDVVYRQWGFARKVPWGQGITALFYGPPGTGKTMAATAIANELGLPLYRVDLSQLISKYIGETQKNIGRVFDGAAHSGGILFFDEADALFSRRSEVGDSQDKYANAEIAYLLQRTEAHGGLCILATNLLQNFDEAFRRRITYMINFPLPDMEQRRRIWLGVFPQETGMEGLETDLLAKELELSGASIKNCAVHAAYRAASEGGSITMEMILDGAREEYAKQGKTLSPYIQQLLANKEVRT